MCSWTGSCTRSTAPERVVGVLGSEALGRAAALLGSVSAARAAASAESGPAAVLLALGLGAVSPAPVSAPAAASVRVQGWMGQCICSWGRTSTDRWSGSR